MYLPISVRTSLPHRRVSRTPFPALVFPGEIHGFGLKILPEFARQRDIIAACGQTFNEQRFQPRVFLALLRNAEQRAEIFSDVAIALRRKLFIDKRLQGFR